VSSGGRTVKVFAAASGDAFTEWKGSFSPKELPAGDVVRFSAAGDAPRRWHMRTR
jgi:hypothetical protein